MPSGSSARSPRIALPRTLTRPLPTTIRPSPWPRSWGCGPLQAHCHRGLGRLYAATGQWELARAELSTAIEMYQAMEMTFWLPETEAALVQMAAL